MKIVKWVNLGFFFLMIAANTLANLLSLGGNTTGQVSARYPTLFTPAPYTFLIWAVIYILVCIFIGLQCFASANSSDALLMAQRIRIWFPLSCLMNILWILTWHFDKIGLSTLCILGLLVCLIFINQKLHDIIPSSIWDQLALAGFQIYLGWITAAVIANISVFLKKINWNRFGLSEQFWTVVVILAATAIAIAMIVLQKQFLAALAIVWAFIGIAVKHFSPSGYNGVYSIILTILILSIILILMIIRVFLPPALYDKFSKG